jgi:RHS repeat-associated protein
MFTLDALGRVVQGQHGNLNPVHVAYDDRGRLESISSGSGMDTRSYSYTYNAQGFVETVTDPIGRSVHITNDAAGRVINKTLPDGRLIEFGYDAAGNVTSLTPPGRPAHTLSYSDRGELTIINPPAVPGSGPTTRTYDPDQQLTTGARPDSQTVAIGYDSAGRQNRRVLATGGVTNAIDTATYDPAGLVSSIATDSGVATSYAYDGNLLTKESWTGTIAGDVSRTLNASLRLASQSVNGTNSVTFDYDNDDLLIGVGDLTISRDAQHGLRTGSSIGTISTSIGYDGFGELTNYIATASGTAQFGMRFTRDGLGRISQKTETVAGLTSRFDYSYDLSGQIATIIKNGAVVESYDYDGNGNRTTATVGGTGITATYDDQDRLTLYGGTSYTYNGAGDLHTRTTGAQVTACDYDQVGNLLRVILPDGTVIAYIVDALDRRIGKKVNGTLVQGFLYGDNLRPLAQLDGTGMVMSRFVYASGTVPAYMIKGGASFRLITDQVGSVRLVINAATGAIAQRMDYDSFGNVLLDTNPGFQPFGFAGGLYDTDTKLVRFGARDYDAETGRWTTKDPVSFGGGDANLYRYVRNDPVNRIDPTGTSEKTRLEREIALEAEFLQDLQGHRPPPGGNTLSLVEQEQWILDWRVKRSVVEIYEAEQTERFARLRRLNRRLKQGGAVLTVAVAAISCYGISARAQAAGKTPVQQFDDEGRKDFQADIQDVKKYFVDPVVDFVSGAFAGIL